MTLDLATASLPEELLVPIEQANALIDMIATPAGSSRMSSLALASGLVASGLASVNGLTGDAERILGPARGIDMRLAIRLVSPRNPLGVRELRIWPASPQSVVMRTDTDGAHFIQVDHCEVPHILAIESLLQAGPTLHDGPPFIPSDFVQAVRAVDLEAAQSVLNELATCGPADSHFAQDCTAGRWSVVMCVREEKTPDGWTFHGHLECFVTEHMHALIHAPLDPNVLSLMQQEPTLDAPPRTALWENLMELLAS